MASNASFKPHVWCNMIIHKNSGPIWGDEAEYAIVSQ